MRPQEIYQETIRHFLGPISSLLDDPSVSQVLINGAAPAEVLRIIVELHKNPVTSGGTGTGKTSMLNARSAAIPANERIIVIEDSSELQLNQPHTVYLEAQPARPDGKGQVTIRDLFV